MTLRKIIKLAHGENESHVETEETTIDLIHLNHLSLQFECESDCTDFLKRIWRCISIPTREEDLVGKWIAAIYETKTKSILCVGKMMKRFLKEKDGQTESMELDCLVPAYRKDTKVLSEVSEKFDRDVSIFQAENIIAGPLHAVYLGMANWSFADYPLINKLYSMVSKINRNAEYNIYFSN